MVKRNWNDGRNIGNVELVTVRRYPVLAGNVTGTIGEQIDRMICNAAQDDSELREVRLVLDAE